MIADARIEELAQKHLANTKRGAKLAIMGEENVFFRQVRRKAKEVGIEIIDGFSATAPVLMDSKSEKKYVLVGRNDIDCLSEISQGMSCVSQATFELLQTYSLIGKHVVIVGRGHATKGLAKRLLAEQATVTVAHSKTRYLSTILMDADIIVVASPKIERFRPTGNKVIVDVSGVCNESIKDSCDYTKHIGKLTVAILLERASNF